MKKEKITAENFYLESDNFTAHLTYCNFFEIRAKNGRYVDCKMTVEEVKEAFIYYEQRKSFAESAGDYLESPNFYAKICDARISHIIFTKEGNQVKYSLYGDDIVDILKQAEEKLAEEKLKY